MVFVILYISVQCTLGGSEAPLLSTTSGNVTISAAGAKVRKRHFDNNRFTHKTQQVIVIGFQPHIWKLHRQNAQDKQQQAHMQAQHVD